MHIRKAINAIVLIPKPVLAGHWLALNNFPQASRCAFDRRLQIWVVFMYTCPDALQWDTTTNLYALKHNQGIMCNAKAMEAYILLRLVMRDHFGIL